ATRKAARAKGARKAGSRAKSARKAAPKKGAVAAVSAPSAALPIARTTQTLPSVVAGRSSEVGIVTHYYPHVEAAVVAVGPGELRAGDTVHFRGHTTDFYQTLDRLEYDHKPIEVAKPGQQVGVHVSQRVREGDIVKLIA
ncbi:MAG TPA: hypothetical protein VEC18_04270, partial [Myxococcota bacterium]|nr:hypothetical protein [Myxococcota bacterium]